MGNRKQPFGYRMTLGEITILPEEAELLSRSLSSRRLEGLSALLRQYSAECAYNVGAGHVLGALCAQWERLLHTTR